MLSAWIKIKVTLADGSNRSGVQNYESALRELRILLLIKSIILIWTITAYNGGVSLIKEVIEIPTDTADDTVNYVTDAAESSQCYCCGTGLTSKY